ncbi:phage portal protein [Gemmobacter lanyuensis]
MAWFYPVGGVSKAGVRVDERAALSLPATLQALRVISGVFAMAPLHLYSRSSVGRQRMDGVPAEVLLASRPNGFQTPFDLFELLMADLLLAGNFYAYVSRNMRGDPVALTRLEPQTVLVAKFLTARRGRSFSTTRRFLTDRVKGSPLATFGMCEACPVMVLLALIRCNTAAKRWWRNRDGGSQQQVLEQGRKAIDSSDDHAKGQSRRQDEDP